MKRVRCPKCENYLTFDETRYTRGQSLVFVCDHCHKQFSIRLGKAPLEAPLNPPKGGTYNSVGVGSPPFGGIEGGFEGGCSFGSITVIENVFGYKQELPLREGDNVIGRHSAGTEVQVPIETSDMSMDRRHCIINVKRNKQGSLTYTLRDAPSLTGTFLNNEILNDRDRVRIEDGAIVTIGATTFILRAAQ